MLRREYGAVSGRAARDKEGTKMGFFGTVLSGGLRAFGGRGEINYFSEPEGFKPSLEKLATVEN